MAKASTHDTTQVTHENRLPGRAPEKHDDNGGELGDPTPMEPPLGYKRSLSLSEQIAQQVRIAQLRQLEDAAIDETEDEADDFEIGEDYEPLSKYENDTMPTLANLKKRAAQINAAIEKRKLQLAIDQQKDRIQRHNDKKAAPEAPPTPTADEPAP